MIKFSDVAIFFLIIAQFLDGVLTYLGVTYFNTTEAEGNPLIKYLMNTIGIENSLILTKAITIFALIYLFKKIKYRDFITNFCLTCCLLVYSYAVFGWVFVLWF